MSARSRLLALAGRILACSVLVGASGAATAHPHVWVTSTSEIILGAKGELTGIRHRWSFDEAFSSYAAQGLDANSDGKLSREELAPLAEVNVTSMADFDFFTFAESGELAVDFDKPVDYFLESEAGVLTLHFTLPVKSGAHAGKPLKVEIYDPSFFVDFALAEQDAAKLVGGGPGCKLAVIRPKTGAGGGQQLSEAFFNSVTSAADYAEKLASRIEVDCAP